MSIRTTLLPLLSRATASTSTSTAAFSTSAISEESKAKRKSRLVKRSNVDHKAALTRAHAASTPDSVSGYATGQSKLWDESVLKSILLKREDIWGTTVRGDSLAEEEQAQPEKVETILPKYYNFGLNSAAIELLTRKLPDVSATRSILTPSGAPKVFDEAVHNRARAAEEQELEKRNRLLRVIDLKNADSKGITVENTRRIVAVFGVKGSADTGSPEVQAAIMTARIHGLMSHLSVQTRDIHNRRALRSLVQQRVKVLKYLKTKNVGRYEECLIKIGVEARSVENEVIVSKKALKSLLVASA